MKEPERIQIKLFAVLVFTLFCSMAGAGIVAPLLPVYAQELGAPAVMIGFIFAAFSISRSIALPTLGFLSDRFGKKRFILFGLFSYIVVSLSYCFANSPWVLVWIRLGHGLAAAMIVPVASAYVGELSPGGEEGKYMGLLNVGIFGGLGIGPFAGGVISDVWGMKVAFLTMAALNLLAMIVVLLLVPERKGDGRALDAGSYLKIIKNRRVITLMVYRASHFFGVGIIWSFVPLLVVSGKRISATHSGTLISLSVLTATVMQAPVGKLSDKYDRKNIALLGGGFMVIAMLLVPMAKSFSLLSLGIVLTGFAGGFISPAVSALTVSEGKFQNAMGSVMGLVLMGQSLGIMVGPVVGGKLADQFSIPAAFYSGAVVALLGIIFFFLFGKDFNYEAAAEQTLPVGGV